MNNPHLLTLIFVLLFCVGGAYSAATCNGNCTTNSDCGGSCNTCNITSTIKGVPHGVCACPNGQSSCLTDYYANTYTCYNPSTSICYPANPYTRTGAACPNNRSSLCNGEFMSGCYNPQTEQCCPAGRTGGACLKTQTCCGESVCADPATQQCCCYVYGAGGTLACPLNYTCNCDTYPLTCSPPTPPTTTTPPPGCNGQGVCNSGTCTCSTNYYPASNCSSTISCTKYCSSNSTCNNNGNCDPNGACVCAKGFTGSACNQCAKGYYPQGSCNLYNPCLDGFVCAFPTKCANNSQSSASCVPATYFIANAQTGLVITGGAAGVNLVVNTKATANFTNQLWYFVQGYIQNVQSSLVVDVNGGNVYEGKEVITWQEKPFVSDYENDNQLWTYDTTTSALISKQADYVIDVEYGSLTPNSALIVWWPNNQTNQQWVFQEYDG